MTTPSWNAARSFSTRVFPPTEVMSDDEKQPLRPEWRTAFQCDGANSAQFRLTRHESVTSCLAEELTCSTDAKYAKAVFLHTPCIWTIDNSHSFAFSRQNIQNARRLWIFQPVILSFSHNLLTCCREHKPHRYLGPGYCSASQRLGCLDVIQRILEVP